jgi:hypothetical protein
LRGDLSVYQSPLEVDGLIVRAVQIADDRDLHSWPRTTSMLSRAATPKVAEIKLLLFAARLSAFRVAEAPDAPAAVSIFRANARRQHIRRG